MLIATVSQNLAPGIYTGAITVNAANAVNNPLVVPVSVTIDVPGVASGSSGKPIVFVHGFCGNSKGWSALREDLSGRLHQDFPNAYSETTNYDVYYNGFFVEYPVGPPPSARFFTLMFYDPIAGSVQPTNGLNPSNVARISILNKANELAEVIADITRLTNTDSVILVAHSMGGLVARAYLQNMASTSECYNYGENAPDYFHGCMPGSNGFKQDVAALVTIDTPHGGSDLALINDQVFGDVFQSCVGEPSTTKTEMEPHSDFLQTLNYFNRVIAIPGHIPPTVHINSIESYYSDPETDPLLETIGWPECGGLSPQLCRMDTVISTNNQSMQLSLSPSFRNGTRFADWGNPYTVEQLQDRPECQQTVTLGSIPVLHFIECVGEQSNTKALVHLLIKPDIGGHGPQ